MLKTIEESMPPEQMAVMGVLLLKLWNGSLEYYCWDGCMYPWSCVSSGTV